MNAAIMEADVYSPCRGLTTSATLPAVKPLVVLLRQLAELIESLTDGQYAQKPVGLVPSSVGGHVRHSLDHLGALLNSVGDDVLDYDHRQRGTDVERCRGAALKTIAQLEGRLLELGPVDATAPMRLSVLLSADAPPVEVLTTLERELAFVLSHTIHHNSLIGVIAGLLGVAVPARFGYAPSTLAHLGGQRCVR